MLPTPEQTWLTDDEGRRYASELRFVAVDEAPARGSRLSGSRLLSVGDSSSRSRARLSGARLNGAWLNGTWLRGCDGA